MNLSLPRTVLEARDPLPLSPLPCFFLAERPVVTQAASVGSQPPLSRGCREAEDEAKTGRHSSDAHQMPAVLGQYFSSLELQKLSLGFCLENAL